PRALSATSPAGSGAGWRYVSPRPPGQRSGDVAGPPARPPSRTWALRRGRWSLGPARAAGEGPPPGRRWRTPREPPTPPSRARPVGPRREPDRSGRAGSRWSGERSSRRVVHADDRGSPRLPQVSDDACHLVQGTRILRQVGVRSEEHTSELQSRENLVCRLL